MRPSAAAGFGYAGIVPWPAHSRNTPIAAIAAWSCVSRCETGRPDYGLALGFGFVQGRGGANECLQRFLVYLLALVEVDGTPCVPVKNGVEEVRRILQNRPLAKVIFRMFL
jgi:hypothetical protein